VNIILDADTSDCPGCVCKILNSTESRSILVQEDHQAVGVAPTFGWSVRDVGDGECDHDGTDGSVDCKECGTKAIEFISAAIEFINDHDGDVAEDPGYFEEDDQ
jgi:hypothetical protein